MGEEEICPPGCDQDLYDKVRELRVRKLDTEEILNNFQKEVDDFRKQRDRFLQRQKQIVKDVKGTLLEIQAFQNEKQRGMNELDIVLGIPVSETRCLEAKMVPNEVVDEKRILWMKYKEKQKRGRRLEAAKKEKEKLIAELNEKCVDLQMLKFGQIIDLTSLDRMAVSSAVVDLKEKIRVQEQKKRTASQQGEAQAQEGRAGADASHTRQYTETDKDWGLDPAHAQPAGSTRRRYRRKQYRLYRRSKRHQGCTRTTQTCTLSASAGTRS